MQNWFLIENEKDYQKAASRYEEIREAAKESDEYREKQLLAFLINHYEEQLWEMPVVDPIELIKIRLYKKSPQEQKFPPEQITSQKIFSCRLTSWRSAAAPSATPPIKAICYQSKKPMPC